MIAETGVLLLTVIGGYWMLERAEAQKGPLQRLGRVLAIFVITVSVIGAICQVVCVASGNCGSMAAGSKYYCPMTPKMPHAQALPPGHPPLE
jgi:hypothetical protein